MRIILCPKSWGNTRKIGNAIAAEGGWEILRITGKEALDLSAYEDVIICSGIYWGKPQKRLIRFIQRLKNGQGPGKVHVLLTWVGRGESDQKVFSRIEKELSEKGIPVSKEYMKVYAHSFGVFHIGKPDQKDIEACIRWAEDF